MERATARTEDLFELVYRSGLDDVEDGDDVLADTCLAEELEELQLS